MNRWRRRTDSRVRGSNVAAWTVVGMAALLILGSAIFDRPFVLVSILCATGLATVLLSRMRAIFIAFIVAISPLAILQLSRTLSESSLYNTSPDTVCCASNLLGPAAVVSVPYHATATIDASFVTLHEEITVDMTAVTELGSDGSILGKPSKNATVSTVSPIGDWKFDHVTDGAKVYLRRQIFPLQRESLIKLSFAVNVDLGDLATSDDSEDATAVPANGSILVITAPSDAIIDLSPPAASEASGTGDSVVDTVDLDPSVNAINGDVLTPFARTFFGKPIDTFYSLKFLPQIVFAVLGALILALRKQFKIIASKMWLRLVSPLRRKSRRILAMENAASGRSPLRPHRRKMRAAAEPRLRHITRARRPR
jgi:hypothetical protein